MATLPGADGEGSVLFRSGTSPRPRVVLDTDAANEVDDQFALAHLLLSPDRIQLEAVYAAPFHNHRSSGPADGMRQSLDEIHRVGEAAARHAVPIPATYEGSTRWLSRDDPEPSPAALDLIERCRGADVPLYVLAIGTPTNVANALVLAPDIAATLVLVWLGSNPSGWTAAPEFNAAQDPAAVDQIMSSGVPLVHIPCRGVSEHLRLTHPEVDAYVAPTDGLGAYLAGVFREQVRATPGHSRPIWDLGATAWILSPAWVAADVVHRPRITPAGWWAADRGQDLMLEARWLDRDGIFADLFDRFRS